jgi:pimeloyl-ACP methyl ester carboxylesterase
MSSRYRDGFIDVPDGLRLHYVDFAGNLPGRPLLCLHGLTRNARDFTEFAERLSPKFRVIALDFRGRGSSDSDPLPARYNPVTYAGDVIELLDQLDIASAILVGTSLGGLVTMILGTTAPERVAGAILNDVGPELDQAGLDRIQSYLGKDLRFSAWDEAAAAICANQGGAFPRWTHDQWVAAAHRYCREQDGEIRFDYDMAIAEPFRTAGPAPKVDLWPFFAALARKPLLVVRGELSDLLSADAMTKMHEAAPGLRSVAVPGVGHAPTLDEPEAVAAIDAFLADIAP